MTIKANKWQKKEKKRPITLFVYNFTILMLILQSNNFERSFLSLSYITFAIFPIFSLFSYHTKEYEPNFNWYKYLKNHKIVIIIFISLIISQWPMNHIIANELVGAHNTWIENGMKEKSFYNSYNASKIASFDGSIHDYLMNYNPDNIQIQTYSGTQIAFSDQYNNLDVYIVYQLDGVDWKLQFIDLIDISK
jgi:hypothetical protein